MSEEIQLRANKLHTEIKGTPSDNNPLTEWVSPSREGMTVKHKQQTPIINSEINHIIGGQEKEYGTYAFKSIIEDNVQILGTFQRYKQTYYNGRQIPIPETIVVHVNMNGVINYTRLNRHELRHPTIGYENRYLNLDQLTVGNYVSEGTVLGQSNAVKEGNIYASGINLRTLFASHPSTTEDGMMISTTAAERLGFYFVERHKVSFGTNMFPLNMFGDDNTYKIFPDIGEKVGSEGVLIALRSYDKAPVAAKMSRKALRKLDYLTDFRIKVDPETEVVDIIIHHNDNTRSRGKDTPSKMVSQPMSYYLKMRQFYESIEKCVNDYRKKAGFNKTQTHPHLNRLIDKAAEYKANIINQHLTKVYKNVPNDEWEVELLVRKRVVPGYGYKLTGFHSANKGVICDIREPQDMPRGEDGIPVDIVLEALSIIKRIIPSAAFENGLNAYRMQVEDELKRIVKSTGDYEKAFAHMADFARRIGNEYHQSILASGRTQDEREAHVKHVMKHHLYMEIPNAKEKSLLDAITDIVQYYPSVKQHVYFLKDNGEWVKSIARFVVGTTHFIPLEKTPSGWAGISTIKRNHYMVAAKLSSSDKLQTIGREQPLHVIGEGEKRLAMSNAGGQAIKRVIAISNNIEAHMEVCENILSNDKPFQLESIYDDTKHRKANIVKIGDLINNVAGVKIVDD